MIVERVYELDRIYKVLKDPEIFARIAEDNISIEDYKAPEDVIYIMDQLDTCLMIYHWRNQATLECHVHVLKNSRLNALAFGQSALDWAWDNTDAMKIIAEIPEIYPDVLKFALKNGFEIEGLNKSSYLKGGELYSQTYLGLMR